ncbi:hypothetical protein EVAR_13210_1 [Eumeta japonica]|uniref:Uncharacterized protein n=1 Tax=Eumeta variegata TaxID=151549 RepID=A0A4C1TS54_EUMVA|nr:hypothetical protein EVAR_13210_1 [Eumeta japonica]
MRVVSNEERPIYHRKRERERKIHKELEYLEKFIEVLKPITTALDYMLGNNCYYGKFLPTLISVRTRLERLQDNNLRHFTVILPQLKESLEKRFDKFFTLSPEVNGAWLHDIAWLIWISVVLQP